MGHESDCDREDILSESLKTFIDCPALLLLSSTKWMAFITHSIRKN